MVDVKEHTRLVEMRKVIEESLSYARHAPSSHNTQPWTVTIKNDGIVLGYDPARQLKVGDPNKTELYLSLGCFVESYILAAKDLGYDSNFVYTNKAKNNLATIIMVKNSEKKKNSQLKLILDRRSDRRYYEVKNIPAETIKEISNLSIKDSYPVMLTEQEDIKFLGKVTQEATLAVMSNQDFRNELADWVRNNWTKKPDGMPGYSQGIPGPISLLAKFVIKKNKKVATDQAKKDSKRVIKSAAIVLICVKNEDPKSLINAGRLYQSVCLLALQNGVKSSAVSASVIFPKTRKEIVKQFKLKDEPVALLRLGYTKNLPKRSPRLRINQIVKA